MFLIEMSSWLDLAALTYWFIDTIPLFPLPAECLCSCGLEYIGVACKEIRALLARSPGARCLGW